MSKKKDAKTKGSNALIPPSPRKITRKGIHGGKRVGAGRPRKSSPRNQDRFKLSITDDEFDVFTLTDVQIMHLSIEVNIRQAILREKWERERKTQPLEEHDKIVSEMEAVMDFVAEKGIFPELFVFLERRVSKHPQAITSD